MYRASHHSIALYLRKEIFVNIFTIFSAQTQNNISGAVFPTIQPERRPLKRITSGMSEGIPILQQYSVIGIGCYKDALKNGKSRMCQPSF